MGQHTQETKNKMSRTRKGRPLSLLNKIGLSHPKQKGECPYCNKVGGKPAMIRWHFNNCKQGIFI